MLGVHVCFMQCRALIEAVLSGICCCCSVLTSVRDTITGARLREYIEAEALLIWHVPKRAK